MINDHAYLYPDFVWLIFSSIQRYSGDQKTMIWLSSSFFHNPENFVICNISCNVSSTLFWINFNSSGMKKSLRTSFPFCAQRFCTDKFDANSVQKMRKFRENILVCRELAMLQVLNIFLARLGSRVFFWHVLYKNCTNFQIITHWWINQLALKWFKERKNIIHLVAIVYTS